MRLLLIWASVLIPYTIFGIYVGDKYLSSSNILAFAITGVVLVHLLAYQKQIPSNLIWWQKLFLIFLMSASVSTWFSPYFSGAIARGLFQVAGIASMLAFTLALSLQIAREPEFFGVILKYSMWGLFLVSLIGILQFITFNVFKTDIGFAQLMALNDFAGGSLYKMPSQLGAVFRPNSICREPAHLAQFLGMGAGVSMIRLGVLGGEMKRRIAGVIPLWPAVALLVCLVLTLSIIAYSLVAIVMLALAVLPRKPSLRLVKRLTLFGVIVAGMLLGAIRVAGPTFANKLGTVKLFFATDVGESEDLSTEAISAMAITSNIYVMWENLKERPILGVGFGAHPESYLVHAPDYIRKPDTFRLNAVDAGGLLFRLLSETGYLGTFFFMAGLVAVLARSRRHILRAAGSQGHAMPLAIGVTASLVGVMCVFFMRWANYYDLEMWLLIALTACVPILFAAEAGSGAVKTGP